MIPNEAELERLRLRRPDVVVAEHLAGRPCLVRQDEVLVSAHDYVAAQERADRWVERPELLEPLGVARLRLRPSRRVNVRELVADLRGSRQGGLAVSANHLVKAAPVKWGGPADDPVVASVEPTLVPQEESGRQVSVAVLDTGVAPHRWFADQPWYGDCDPDAAERLDADRDARLDGQAGHGTFVAGVVLQQAPLSRLRIRRVLDSFGESDELELLDALHRLYRWSRKTGEVLDVINMSFGYYTFDDEPSPLVAEAVARFGKTTAVVACAGNHGQDRPFWPAALPGVVAVGALDSDGSNPAPFSNYGPWVDACAVGERVTSSFVTFDGPKPSTGDFDQDRFQGFATWSGTSFAAPKVAGAIAALVAEADLPASHAARQVLDVAGRRAVPGLGVALAESRVKGTAETPAVPTGASADGASFQSDR